MTIIIRYGEIALKGKNQKIFINQLVKNIKDRTQKYKHKIKVVSGRIYLILEEEENLEEVIEILKNTFGIISLSIAKEAKLNLDDIFLEIKNILDDKLKGVKKLTFKVETNRANKGFELKSPEVSREIGHRILVNYGDVLSVDVNNPDFYVNIDIREKAYIYIDKIEGLKGLPYKTSGKALALLSGGIDSPVAIYKMARRGVKIDCIHYHSYPFTSLRAKQKVLDLANELLKYIDEVKVYIINILEIQKNIKEFCPSKEMTILSRRFMMQIAEKIAVENKYQALITGENIAQVASQTIEGLNITNSSVSLPIFRPLLAYEKNEIISIARKINTYEISIQPFEDCCTVFLPKEVVIKPELERIENSQNLLDVEKLIKDAIDNLEIIELKRED